MLRRDLRDDVPQVCEAAANDAPAASHVLEDWHDGGRCAQRAVEELSCDVVGYGLLTRLKACGARVEVVVLDAKGFAALEVVEEGVVALLLFVTVGGRKVDQVGAMWEDVAAGVIAVGFAGGEEGCAI